MGPEDVWSVEGSTGGGGTIGMGVEACTKVGSKEEVRSKGGNEGV